MSRLRPRLLATLLLSLSTSACSLGLLRGYAEGRPPALEPTLAAADSRAARGMTRFVFDDLGTLNTDAMQTHALPWKVAVSTMLMDRRSRGAHLPLTEEAMLGVLEDYGFMRPDSIGNWSGASTPDLGTMPLGILRTTVRRGFPEVEIDLANIGCASCHAGPTWDAEGNPTRTMWLGLPNTSLDLSAYTRDLYRALLLVPDDPDRVLAVVDSIFPATTEAERATLRDHVLPSLSERILELQRDFGGLTPFDPGVPGAQNAVSSLRRMLGMLDHSIDPRMGLSQTPDLGDRVLRTSLTSGGAYHIPGRPRFEAMTRDDVTSDHLDGLARIVAFFSVPAMGGRADRLSEYVGPVREVMDFVETYRPPPFPGAIDSALARRGETVYREACAACHGVTSPGVENVRLVSFPNVLVEGSRIGTDPELRESFDEELLRELRSVGWSEHLGPQPTDGHVAPPLTGIWASAPYLHNASVPTLWHLMNPESRPERFLVGGHRLDLDRVGVALEVGEDGVHRYPADHAPWARPRLYDTRRTGLSNSGHEAEFVSLTVEQKLALLEYLKLL